MSASEIGDRGELAQRRPVVTIAALYGAGGSVVGPRVAERLGVPLLDREIPEDVARRTGLSEEAVGEVDEKPRSGIARLAETLGILSEMKLALPLVSAPEKLIDFVSTPGMDESDWGTA